MEVEEKEKRPWLPVVQQYGEKVAGVVLVEVNVNVCVAVSVCLCVCLCLCL